jgi:DNA-binding XRE family transcriptional regulator
LREAVPMTATSNQEPLNPPEAAAAAETGNERGTPPSVVASSTASTSSGTADSEAADAGATKEPARRGGKKVGADGKAEKVPLQPNNVRKLRQAAMMSKAELARRAGVSPLTIDRVESGCPCRMDTKRKILEALGLSPSAREQVFGPDIDQG